jgi:hypothetical protein
MFEQDKTRHWASGVPQEATKENVSVIGLPRESVWVRPPVSSHAASAPTRISWTSLRTSEFDRWLVR